MEKTLHSDLIALDDSALDSVAGGCGGKGGFSAPAPTGFGETFALNTNVINFEDNVIVAGDDVNITLVQG